MDINTVLLIAVFLLLLFIVYYLLYLKKGVEKLHNKVITVAREGLIYPLISRFKQYGPYPINYNFRDSSLYGGYPVNY